jgi:hypothetical protein
MAIGGWDSLRDLDRSSLRDDAGRPIGSPPVDPVQSSPVAVAR